MKVGVAIITHRAKQHLSHCLPPLIHSPLKPKILLVNSSSNDGTVEEAKRFGAQTLVIPRDDFNHGTTRDLARRTLNTDIVVMMTPDAYPEDRYSLGKLVEPIGQKKAVVSYGRQLPHTGAGLFERFPRDFNYSSESHIRSIDDIDKYGIYTFFCSDSFAAYSNEALERVGGFPSVLLGEDTCVVAKLLYKGEKIAYVAEACVKHSHKYSLLQEFRRHFDTGLARKEYGQLIEAGGKDEKRGSAFARSLLKNVGRKRPHLLPYALLHLSSKWLGYRIGRLSTNAPIGWKKSLSSQDFYWERRAS